LKLTGGIQSVSANLSGGGEASASTQAFLYDAAIMINECGLVLCHQYLEFVRQCLPALMRNSNVS
jgi:hypothetical protein